MRIKVLIYLTVWLQVSNKSLQAQDLNVFITQDSITIGDQFSLWIQGFYSAQDFSWISQNTDLGAFEIIEFGDVLVRDAQDSSAFEQQLILQAWEEGIQWIPPLAYRKGNDSLSTDSLMIPIYPYPIDTNNVALKAAKPLVDAPFEWLELKKFFWIPLAILAFIIIYLLFKKWKRKKEELKPEIQIAPHEWAYSRLDELKNKKLIDQNKLKEYYSELSYIMRGYLERRYGHPALEKTTKEITMGPIRKEVDRAELIKMREGLEMMDLVKFAKFIPDDSHHHAAWQSIYDFVTLSGVDHISEHENEDLV